MPARLNRREFLTASGLAVVGAAGLAACGSAGESSGTSDASGRPLSAPGTPAAHRSFVSRPDLKPPAVTMTTAPHAPTSPSYFALTPNMSGGGASKPGAQTGLMLVNRSGELVWFRPRDPSSEDPFNLNVQTYKGRAVLTWFEGTIVNGHGKEGRYVLADGSYRQVAAFRAVNHGSDLHEFNLTADGTALVTAYEPRSIDGSDVLVGHAQEIDVASDSLVYDWATYPAVPVSDGYATGDYFHINSIDLWPGSDRDLLISGRNVCAVYRVSRTKGIVWKLGGKHPTIKGDASAAFAYQHHVRALADGSGVTIFDDASGGPGNIYGEQRSWAKTVTVDPAKGSTGLVHEMTHPGVRLRADFLGSYQLLPDGGSVVGWGDTGYFTQFAPPDNGVTPAPVLDARMDMQSYRAFGVDWTGTPPESELALVVHPGTSSDAFRAFVSWNGATEVAHWTIAAGRSESSLSRVALADHRKFEDELRFVHSGARVAQATAHDRQGRVLGRSKVVSVD